jgi:4-amino-4-deoxy-L-arabinose transferase-like glycosyltransferase
MFMWLQAGSYLLVGNWRVAFLLPSLLAALATLWCVVDLGRRLWTPRVGLYTGWALLLTLHFTGQAKKAQIDALLMFWITLANYGLLRHLLRGPDWPMWWLGWFAAGLGTITKGVGCLALTMLVPAAFAALRGWPGIALHLRGGWRLWIAPAFLLLAMGLWLVPMLVAALGSDVPEYRAYVDDILFRQTVQRYTDSWQHAQPPWFFVKIMVTRWLPLLLLLPWAVPAWWRRILRNDPRILLPLAWWLMVVLFFSIPLGKRAVYILPALPMACLAMAPLLPGLMRKLGPQRLASGFVLVLAGSALALAVAVMWPQGPLRERLAEGRGFTTFGELAAMLGGLGALGMLLAMRYRGARAWVALAMLLGAGWVGYGLVGYPLLNDSTSGRELMQQVARRLPSDAQLGMVAWREQLVIQADRPVATFGFDRPWDQQLVRARDWQLQVPRRRWLLIEERALSPCVDRAQAEYAGNNNHRRWWLVSARAHRPGCTPPPHPVEVDADALD